MTPKRHVLALALLAAGALAACGGGPSADEVLSETAGKLGDVRSGKLSMRVVLEPLERSRAGRVGFALDGPFSLGKQSRLPEARVAYTQIAGPREGKVVLVSNGREAFVESGGKAYALPPERANELESSSRAVRGREGLDGLRIDGWLDDAQRTDGGRVGGAQTDRVTAELDAARALDDVFALARRAGGGDAFPRIDRDGRRQLDDAVRESRVSVWSGREDRLLRRLELRVEFRAEVPRELRDDLGRLAGARLTFDLELGDPNRPVEVRTPEDPRPYAELAGAAAGG